MRKITLFLSLLLIGSVGFSQIIPGVNIGKRKEYMMRTYKINSQKADEYEQILFSLQKENDQLKSRKISSAQFKVEQKKLYKKYGIIVSQTFFEGKYKKWSSCTQEMERYQVLSENKFVPYEQMRALYQAESAWVKERDKMHKDAGEAWEKYENSDTMLSELNIKIKKILGVENGTWYIEYKRLFFRALDDMDKYEVAYKDAFTIAQIEDTYKQKRIDIFNSNKKNAEREVALMAIDDEMAKKIAVAVPSASAKWRKVNNAALDHILKSKYGLDQKQINEFKIAYNKYAIEEYKILNQKKLPDTDKYDQLSQLGDNFCKTVNPLFKTDSYKKWCGWWKYDFERKMKRKGLK